MCVVRLTYIYFYVSYPNKHRRRWANIGQTLVECLVFAGMTFVVSKTHVSICQCTQIQAKTGRSEPPEDNEMNQMTLPTR